MRVINDITSILGITGGGGAGGFSPDDIPGLQLWLEASPANTGAVEGGTIATWTDLSAAGNDASQATEAARPTLQLVNGVWVVRFDGSDDWMSFSGLVADSPTTTIIALVKLLTAGGVSYKAILALGQQRHYAHMVSSQTWGGFNGGEIGSGEIVSDAYKVTTQLTRAFDDVDLVTDGVLVNRTSGTGVTANASAALGALGASSQPGDIDLHAVLAYDSALSTADREAVEAHYAPTVTALNA